MEAQVCMVFHVDSPSVRAGGTFFCKGAGIYTSASERAAVFVRILYGIIPPWAHFMPGRADGMSGFIEGDVIRGIFRRLCPPVDINEGIDIPVFQQLIGREIVMCGVKADIFRRNAKGIASEIIYGIEEVFAVMAAGVSEFH